MLRVCILHVLCGVGWSAEEAAARGAIVVPSLLCCVLSQMQLCSRLCPNYRPGRHGPRSPYQGLENILFRLSVYRTHIRRHRPVMWSNSASLRSTLRTRQRCYITPLGAHSRGIRSVWTRTFGFSRMKRLVVRVLPLAPPAGS